jgi:hypothetical protein
VSVQAIAWVLDHSQSRGSARCVLISIANHVGPDGTGWVHVRRVMSEANCSHDSYRRAVQQAVEAGELVREVHAGGSLRMHDAHRPNLFTFPGVAVGGLPTTHKPAGNALDGDLGGNQGTSAGFTTDDPVPGLFDLWVEVVGRDPKRTRLTAQRRKKIQARLAEGYTVAEIEAAIRGVVLSGWHMGDNEQRTRYDDLTVICRDGAQVERFAGLSENTPTPAPARVSNVRRGCDRCDNGFIMHDDGTVSVCDCPGVPDEVHELWDPDDPVADRGRDDVFTLSS